MREFILINILSLTSLGGAQITLYERFPGIKTAFQLRAREEA